MTQESTPLTMEQVEKLANDAAYGQQAVHALDAIIKLRDMAIASLQNATPQDREQQTKGRPEARLGE